MALMAPPSLFPGRRTIIGFGLYLSFGSERGYEKLAIAEEIQQWSVLFFRTPAVVVNFLLYQHPSRKILFWFHPATIARRGLRESKICYTLSTTEYTSREWRC
jgi:hypothetical protein